MRILILALVAAITATASFAQGQNCAERAEMIAHLAQKYGEARQSMGLMPGGQVLEMYANTETGTWTIVITRPDGFSCIPATGQNFEEIDEDLTPAGLLL